MISSFLQKGAVALHAGGIFSLPDCNYFCKLSMYTTVMSMILEVVCYVLDLLHLSLSVDTLFRGITLCWCCSGNEFVEFFMPYRPVSYMGQNTFNLYISQLCIVR